MKDKTLFRDVKNKNRSQIDQPTASFLKTCNGGLFKTLLLFINPMIKTNKLIPGNKTRKGNEDGINAKSNIK